MPFLEEDFSVYVGGRIGFSCGNLYYRGTVKQIGLLGDILSVSFVGKTKECYGSKTTGDWHDIEKITTFNLAGAECVGSERNKDKLLIFLADSSCLSLFSPNNEGAELDERELENCVDEG